MHKSSKSIPVVVRARSTIESLESRQLFSVLTVSPGGSIQAAVNAAHSGDTVRVKAGTYVEQVTIPASKKNLTITSTGSGVVTIKAPAILTDTADAIVHDAGAQNFELIGVTIAGPSHNLKFGILVDGGGSADIDSVHVTGVQDTVLSLDSSAGVGIGVTSGYATIDDSAIDSYERAGIRVGPQLSVGGTPLFVPGPGASADIENVKVTGIGPSSLVLQDGIDFEFGGGGSVSGAAVSGNVYTPQTFAGTGILTFDSRQVSICDSTFFNNDENVAIDAGPNHNGGSYGVQVNEVESYGATFDGFDLVDGVHGVSVSAAYSHNNALDGIFVDAASTGNTICGSKFSSNGAFDAEDLTYNPFVPVRNNNAGTANTWIGNWIGTSNDPNLQNGNGHGHGHGHSHGSGH